MPCSRRNYWNICWDRHWHRLAVKSKHKMNKRSLVFDARVDSMIFPAKPLVHSTTGFIYIKFNAHSEWYVTRFSTKALIVFDHSLLLCVLITVAGRWREIVALATRHLSTGAVCVTKYCAADSLTDCGHLGKHGYKRVGNRMIDGWRENRNACGRLVPRKIVNIQWHRIKRKEYFIVFT